jgi:hypothetical protein
MTKKLILAICAVAALVLASAVDADVIYTGVDNGVGPGGARPNSDTAAAAFDADAGSIGTMELIDFESLTVQYFTNLEIAPGVTATMVGTIDDAAEGGITNDTQLPTILGYNTTAGGENYLRFVPEFDVGTATLTITFDTPVQAWGAYLTGLETDIAGDLYIVYDDGSVVEHAIAGTANGGVQFFGFTDSGMLISQIVLEERNISSTRDIWGLDDMRYTPIPEPASMLMLGALGAGLAGARKARRKK